MNINNYIEFLGKNKLELINHYVNSFLDKNIKNHINEIISNIIKIYTKHITLEKRIEFYDLGKIYEKIIPYEKRKLSGEIYTPKSTVDYILDKIEYIPYESIENKKIIDLSCGSGSFILEAIKRYIERYHILYKVNDIIKLDANILKNIIKNLKKNIIGVDINPIACIICQINIYLILYNIFNKILESEYDYCIPIFDIYNKNSLRISKKNEYDFIVGNPPYLFIRDIPKNQRTIIKNQEFETNIGQYDYFQIFIELGIKLLKDKGYLGYIVPDSLLALSNRAPIRNYVKNTTKIIEIFYTGPKFENSVVSNIIIIFQKEKEESMRNNNKIHINIANSKFENPHKIIQTELENWDNQFLIHLNFKDNIILNHLIDHFPKVKNLIEEDRFKIELNRGVELSKEGLVFYCNTCQKYYPLPKNKENCRICGERFTEDQTEKIILDKPPIREISDYKPYIYSLKRYKIKTYKYINMKKKGIQYKNLDNYKNRIIIRQINQNNLICASYDNDLSLCSQSFYNLKVIDSPIKEFDNLFLLGLINSHLLSYFFMKSFGSYKKLFPRILIEKIKFLPIKIPENKNEKIKAQRIRSNVKILLDLDDQSKQQQKIQKLINYEIYDLYQIENSNREYIEQYFKMT